MLAAHASAKAHEEECRFLAERAFEAEAQAQTRLAEARRELSVRWDEETAAHDSELAAVHAREEDANEAYGELVRAVDAERVRWASERAARDAELEAERATWAAERAALVEALEVSYDTSSLEAAPRDGDHKAHDGDRVVRVIQSVTAAVTAERAKAFADVNLENAAARADAAAADALARADAREAARREDALRAELAEVRAELVGTEASRAAFESAAARAARDAALAEAEAREAREERGAVADAERRVRRAEMDGERTS